MALNAASAFAADDRPNIMIITLDDMGVLTTGIEGCSVGATENIDRLGAEGMFFSYCYNMTPMSGPSRNALLSGRYPHCNGVMGHGKQPPAFWQAPAVVTPRISTYLHDNGYYTAAILKNSREIWNTWDVSYNELPFGVGEYDRTPQAFFIRTSAAIKSASDSNKPFFIYVNPIDPHDPWPDTEKEDRMLSMWNPNRKYREPSKRYSADEVEVPAFLPDFPEIRQNLSDYYSSLYRGDECVGAILRALSLSGEAENTLIFFISDNGMDAPGAKNCLTPWGVRTPLIVKWPGKILPGTRDTESVIATIDIVPTIIDAVGLPQLNGIEGHSFYDVIMARKPKHDREYAYTAHTYTNESNEANYFPQRSIIDKEYCYIWNPYVLSSDKQYQSNSVYLSFIPEKYRNDNYSDVNRKIRTIMQKPVEELYDLQKDPGCWNNVADNPDYEKVIVKYRLRLQKEMTETKDPEIFMWNSVE